jgi:hypothetical protein
MNNEEPFRVDLSSLSDLLKYTETYSIPLYQRPYVWQVEQNTRLFDDVLQSYVDDSSHFLGSIVLTGYQKDDFDAWHSDDLVNADFTVWHVVDGQQRLTSMSLLLAALYWDMDSWTKSMSGSENFDAVREECEDLKSRMRGYLRTPINDTGSTLQGKVKIPRLVPVKAIFSNYERIINRGESGRKIRLDKAYQTHQKKLREFREEKLGEASDDAESIGRFYEFYRSLCKTITSDIKFAKITCGIGQDPFQVFESLNGTGVNLSAADRIKNLLMGAGHNQGIKQTYIDNAWNDIADATGSEKEIEGFLIAYMFVQVGKRVSRGKLYDVFEQFYLKGEFDGKVSQAINDLKRVAQLYGLITRNAPFHDDARDVDITLPHNTKQTLSAIIKNNRKQAVVPLLAAARQYGLEEAFENVSKKLLSLLVRHKVCQLGTNELDAIFSQFCKLVKESTAEDAVAFLDSHRQPDSKFERAFADLTFDDNELSRAAYYLHAIEGFLRTSAGNDVLSDDDYTVEHIIPQTLKISEWFADEPEKIEPLEREDSAERVEFFETTVKSIGNMCLLRRREHSSASNRSYNSKLEVYRTLEGEQGQKADATFMLVKQLEDNVIGFGDDHRLIVEDGKTFDENAVHTRASFLAKYAIAIW